MRAATLLITPYIIIWLVTRSRRAFRWIFFTTLLTIQLFSLIPLLIIGIVILKHPAPMASTMAPVGLLPYRSSESPPPLNAMHSRGGEWSGRDYTRPCGTAIIAPFDGSVTRGGHGAIDSWDNTYMYIKSTDGHYEMLIMHSDYILSAGDTFQAGDEIGKTNTHGYSSECHEHISLRVDGETADPENYRGTIMLAGAGNVGNSRSSDYLHLVSRISASYDIEPEFIMGIIQQESAWDARATSSAGAMGLMQLMPGTAADMDVSNAYDPEQNIRGGVRYINWLLNRYNGDKRTALMAYHAGPGNIDRRGATSLDIYYANQVMGYYEGYLDERR